MADKLTPKDHGERVALFRHALIGRLCAQSLARGELTEELKRLAAQHVRPPGSDTTRCFAVSTYEAWLYAYRARGLAGLKPQVRADAGHGQALSEAQRELLLAIKRERPKVSAALILRTLEEDGRLPRGLLRPVTLRRLYTAHGMSALQSRQLAGAEQDRRRWEAPQPNAVWHADVCHGPALTIHGKSVPLRIHALLDDHSRCVLAIRACSTEREVDMLELLVRAWRAHGLSETLYLDNGSTYIGDALAVACSRLGTSLVHAKPHDPQARGKMERLWLTLRRQCLDHIGSMASLHDVQVRLLAWLDRHYQNGPHSSLLGKSPRQVYEAGLPASRERITEAQLRDALTVENRRRIGGDGTLSIAGTLFEAEQSFLAGAKITVCRTLAEPSALPWVQYEGKRLVLQKVDVTANSTRRRDTRRRRGIDAIPFDPAGARLRRIVSDKGGQS